MVIERGGSRVSYEVCGEGPAVLLGHGLLADRTMWRDVVPALAADHRVISIDVRGHGESTAPGPFSLEDLAEDWLAIMDREGIERAVLGGLSMGGMTAMRAALAAPERVAGLVLIDSNAGPEAWRKRISYELMAAVYRRLGAIDPLAVQVTRILFGKTTRTERPEVPRRLVEVLRSHDRAQLPHAIRAVFSRGSIEHRLGEIGCPTLVLVGDEDTATPPAKSTRIRAGIANARLEVIPGAGHMSAMERPDAVATAISGFLSAIQWSGAPAAAGRSGGHE